MSATYLDAIVAFHRARAQNDLRDWTRREVAPVTQSFASALRVSGEHGIGVIAEIKRRSPSKGWLNEALDATGQALLYEHAGARAISVLTDEPHFGGSLNDLARVSAAVSIPTLRKDFIFSRNDILDAVVAGASAVLLIAAALAPSELHDLQAFCREVGIDALVEVHEELEVVIALEGGATIIGVNQRDLRTFAVEADRAERIVAHIPHDVVAVAESGFHAPDAACRAAEVGFDAVLIGEALVTNKDVGRALRSFSGYPVGLRS